MKMKKISNFVWGSSSGDDPPVETHFTEAGSALYKLLPSLIDQLELLDDINSNSEKIISSSHNSEDRKKEIDTKENKSLLFDIIKNILKVDSGYLKSLMAKENFDRVLSSLKERKIVDIKNDVIFSNSGSRKTNIEIPTIIKRVSFIGTNFADGSSLLKVSKVKQMDDLEILSYLNGYRLPYIEAPGRSMYEVFFSNLAKTLISEDQIPCTDFNNNDERWENWKTDKFFYEILQETIYPIYIITEFNVNIIEAILEIITFINHRIRITPLTISKTLNMKEYESPVLAHLFECFNDPYKIYSDFKTGKILKSVTKTIPLSAEGTRDKSKSKSSINWKSELVNYNESFMDALNLYSMNCDIFIEKIKELKEKASDIRIKVKGDNEKKIKQAETFMSCILVYIAGLSNFIKLLSVKGLYSDFIDKSMILIQDLDILQEKYPIKYGGKSTPNTPRNGRKSALSSPRKSGNPSPRSDTESNSDLSGSKRLDPESLRRIFDNMEK